MNVNIKLFSTREEINIDEVKIPSELQQVDLGKLMIAMECYVETGRAEPIIVDENNVLVEGYNSLLIFKSRHYHQIKVYRIKVKIN